MTSDGLARPLPHPAVGLGKPLPCPTYELGKPLPCPTYTLARPLTPPAGCAPAGPEEDDQEARQPSS